MLQALSGGRLMAGVSGILILTAGLFALLWRWEVTAHDHTKERETLLRASVAAAEDSLSRLTDLAKLQNANLLKRDELLQKRLAEIFSLRKMVQKERAIFAQQALAAPFDLGNDQRRFLERILCVSRACENDNNPKPAAADDVAGEKN